MSVFILMIVASHGYTSDGRVAGIYDSEDGCNQARYEMETEQMRLYREMRMPLSSDQFRCAEYAVQTGTVPPFNFGRKN